MKKKSKILVAIGILMSFIIGFFVGNSIDFPKTDNSKLTGTIGRMMNYRNVKVTENDIKLRSELQTNEALLKGYKQYFLFHYTSTAKLCDDIEFAIQTTESIPDFFGKYQTEIENIKKYQQNLEQARKDILLALTSLQNIAETSGNNIGILINNANISIAQAKYKQEDLTGFVEAIESFLKSDVSGDFADLKKVHDMLALNQIILAAATNDKPMLKYLDKKEFLSGSEQLQIFNQEKINQNIQSDFDKLNIFLSENKELGIVCSSEIIGSLENQLNALIPNIEKLGIFVWNSSKLDAFLNSDKLNAISESEKIGIVAKEEKLGAGKEEKLGIVAKEEILGCCIVIFDAEKLGRLLNAEKLGFFSKENIGIYDFEKLSIYNNEQLNRLL